MLNDTSVFYSHKNINQAYTVMENELTKISKWLKANKLIANSKKTKYIIFRTRNKPYYPTVHNLSFNHNVIEETNVTKFLGVYLDCNLNFVHHIDYIAKKISKTVGVITKLKHFLPISTLLTIYKSLLLPHINYAITSWGSANITHLDRLLKFQKKALRAACKTHYLHPSLSLFISTKTLNIFDLFEKNIATFMFNFQNGNVPIVFNQLFRTFESVHNHNTRNKDNLYISKKRTNTAKQSISYTDSKVWNDLPREIRCSKNKFTFNYKLKKYFLKKYKDKCYKCLDTECKICFQL